MIIIMIECSLCYFQKRANSWNDSYTNVYHHHHQLIKPREDASYMLQGLSIIVDVNVMICYKISSAKHGAWPGTTTLLGMR